MLYEIYAVDSDNKREIVNSERFPTSNESNTSSRINSGIKF